jgi:hypothetical protein
LTRRAWVISVIGLLLTLASFLIVVRGPLRAFASAPRSLPVGLEGDQVFFTWAVERAASSESFHAFVWNCDWSASGCIDLRSVPQEWPLLYGLGVIARATNASGATVVSGWYLLNVLLNALAALAFIGTVSGAWLLAGALAPLVAFQQSLIWRINGHLALAAAWPLIASMAAFWRVLEDIRVDRSRRFRFDLPLLIALLLAMAFGSYYYLLFGAILLPAVAVAFAVVHRREGSVLSMLRTRKFAWLLAGVVAAGGSFVAFQLANRPPNRHAATERRPLSDVVACSATWRDYVQPTGLSGAVGLFRRSGLDLPPAAISGRWPWELHGYLGATVLAGLIATMCALLASRVVRRRRPDAPLDAGGAAVLFALAVGAAFLGTGSGGRIVHALVPAARCFNRIAPFTVVFVAAAIATAWRPRPALAGGVAALLFAAGLAEHWRAPLLARERMVPISADLRFAEQFRIACRGERVRLEPPVEDFMFGPYRIYYLAQLARCPLDGVRGPGFQDAPHADPPNARDLVLRWEERQNGFERVRLDERSGPDGVMAEVARYEGG